MTADNKLLGQFDLVGIPPAPRGMPQIEVTFDIDANGIVNVTAKDKATNKEQAIRIQASGGLKDADIDRMVKDAEAHAEEDKKKREEVDAKNEAENLCYATEKLIKDSEDKIESADKDDLNKKVTELREKIKSGSIDDIKSGKEELQKKMYEVSTKLYQQAAPQGENAGQNSGAEQANNNGSENVYNADYKDVDPENNK